MFGYKRIVTQSLIATMIVLLSVSVPQYVFAQESEIAQPGLLARVSLAESGDTITDFRYDSTLNRLFVTTSDNRLHMVDGDDYSVINVLEVGGQLLLDNEAGRLYVGPGDQYVLEGETPSVHVIDTDTLSEIGVLDGVNAVSLDHDGNRLFAGSPVRSSGVGSGSESVQVFDLDTLEPLYEIEQAGLPTYNPARDELIITNYTVLVVDPESGEIIQDLLPELAEQSFQWCNSCEYAMGAHVMPGGDVVLLDMTEITTGGGPGFDPADVYLDAETYEPITAYAERLPLQPTLGTENIPLHPVDDRIIEQQQYNRYVQYNNLVINDLDGEEIAWRDGLQANYINERTGQAYTPQGVVVNLEALVPEGRVLDFDLLADDTENGRVFGAIDGSLLVLGEDDGLVDMPIPSEPEPMPQIGIEQIMVSPAYAEDDAIFVLLEDSRLYRSSDAGQSWTRIQGGLPAEPNVNLSVTLSPSYGDDQTVFAGGHAGLYRGDGVVRSTDGGLTWQPAWDGLEHLRVIDVQVSDDYADDETVYAVADYTHLEPWESGLSLFTSTDQGASWSLTMTATSEADIVAYMDSVTASGEDDIPIRIASYGRALEVQDGDGEWQTANLEQKRGEGIIDIVHSPLESEAGTYYVLGDYSVWRTTDSGESWARWRDSRLVNRTYEDALTALNVTPPLENGGYQLLIGTREGELWMLTPEIPRTAQPTAIATVTPSETVTTTAGTAIESGAVTTDTLAGEVESSAVETEPVAGDEIDYMTATPPDELYRPDGALASVWEASADVRNGLGWAETELALSISAAYEPFERGGMIWNGEDQSIIVLFDDGTYKQFEDTFEEGDQELDPSLQPPGGALQPIRGFGKVWRENQTVRDGIGWALTKESGYSGFLHHFQFGDLITTPSGTLQLVPDGESESTGSWQFAY